MLNVDKFLRVIYREVDLSEVLNKSSCSFNYKNFLNNTYTYNFNDINFRKSIVDKYCKLYPNRYTEDEVNHIIDNYKQMACVEKSKANTHSNNQCNILDVIGEVSNYFLEYRENSIFVSFERLLEWDSLINSIDVNVLISSYVAKRNINVKYTSNIVNHNNERLYRKMSKGYGDTHMHLQASGYSSDINWFRFNQIDINKTKINSGIEKAEFFDYKLHGQDYINEMKLLVQMKLKFIRLYFYDLIKNFKDNNYERLFDLDELKKVINYDSSFSFKSLELKEQILKSHINNNLKSYNSESFNYVLVERTFLTEIFKMYYSKKLVDLEILMFNIYLSGLNIFKFGLIQDNSGMGFSKFKKFESRKKLFIDSKQSDDLIRSVFDKYYREKYVSFIEIRIAPKHKMELINFVKKLDKINNEIFLNFKSKNEKLKKIEYGIVIHYIKDKKEINLSNKISRKGKFLEKLDKDSIKLVKFLEMQNYELGNFNLNSTLYDNKLHEFISKMEKKYFTSGNLDLKSKILGVDAANYEMNCRPENFGPTFRKHTSSLESNKLGITFHVGESFITLSNGLRAIDEAIEYLNMRRGDRLGHAIALGLNAKSYFNIKKNQIFTCVQDHLDDLTWMYNTIVMNEIEDNSILTFLINEIEKYINILYQNLDIVPSKNEYIDSMTLRGDCPEVYRSIVIDDLEEEYEFYVRKFGYRINYYNPKHKSSFTKKKVRKIYYQYHFNETVKKNGIEKIIIKVNDAYLKCVERCQEIIKNKILEKGISIEINPSSNKKISYASKFNEIQLLSLNSKSLIKDGEFNFNKINLPVTINTDDSAVFQTDLMNEYSLIAASLIKDGYDVESVYDYIDYLRESSLELSFIGK